MAVHIEIITTRIGLILIHVLICNIISSPPVKSAPKKKRFVDSAEAKQCVVEFAKL